jgi:hypothetical protein
MSSKIVKSDDAEATDYPRRGSQTVTSRLRRSLSFSAYRLKRGANLSKHTFLHDIPFNGRRPHSCCLYAAGLSRGGVSLRIQLIRKLADVVNGIDLSKRAVGDVFELPHRAAQILLEEGWATLIDRRAGPDRRKTPTLKEH